MKQLKQGIIAATLIGLFAGCTAHNLDVSHAVPTAVIQDCRDNFWQECVQYPFEVKYQTVADNKGIEWQIAYMDEYVGQQAEPPIVVLIHGKGMFAGYLSQLMQDLLAQGYRVIAPDLPNYGKSISGNLDNPVTRSLEDTRVAIHRLLKDELAVDSAAFFGHSMGAQWVVGYALSYPEEVEKLVLEAPGGMEEFPTSVAGISFFGDEQQNSYANWHKIWQSTLQSEIDKTAQDIELFNYFERKDPQSGKIVPASSGYFLVKNEQSQYITDVRQQMIDRSSEEFQRYAQTYIRDIYSMGVEVRKEDPNSLVKRLAEIKAPTFISFGEQEPFIPTTVFSGNQGLKWSVIKPVYERMAQAGNPPLVKVYSDAAHFIHVDQAQAFSIDVVNFLKDGKIYSGSEDVSSYKAPKVTLPSDLEAFFDQFKAALLSQNKDDIARHYADDFQENGFSKAQFLTALYAQLNNVSDYRVTLMTFEQDRRNPNEYLISGKVDLGTINVPFKAGSKLRKTDHGWQWLGNQQ